MKGSCGAPANTEVAILKVRARREYSAAGAWSRAVRTEDGNAVTIQLNGERFEIDEPLTVDALLARLEIDGRRVAVELNEFVVRKAAYADTVVRDGDAVEVVNFVGGG